MVQLSEVQRGVLAELCREMAPALWKLQRVLGGTKQEIERALEELWRQGLVEVKPWGWEPTDAGRNAARLADGEEVEHATCLLYTSPSPRD